MNICYFKWEKIRENVFEFTVAYGTGLELFWRYVRQTKISKVLFSRGGPVISKSFNQAPPRCIEGNELQEVHVGVCSKHHGDFRLCKH